MKPMPMHMPKPPTDEELVRQRQEQVDWNRQSRRVDRRIESHDAAGYETEMIDPAEYDDGYGNRVAHGDLSVQRMVQGNRNAAVSAPQYPTPLDTEPYASKAQARAFFAMEDRGELPEGTARRWAHETPGGIKGLPERKKKD